MINCAENAKRLADGILATGRFKLLSKPTGVPLVAFSLLDKTEHDEYEIADNLKRYGWTVPAYTMAPNAQKVTLLRVVVREDLSHGLVDRLVTDIKRVLDYLDSHPSKLIQAVADVMKEDGQAGHKNVTHEHVKKAAAAVKAGKHDHPNKKVTADEVKEASVFDPEHTKKGHFNVHKKHGLHKTNGVC